MLWNETVWVTFKHCWLQEKRKRSLANTCPWHFLEWKNTQVACWCFTLLYLEITGRFSIYDFGQWLPELVSHKLGSSWCCTTTITRSLVVHCALLYRSICQWLLNSWAWVKAKLAFCRIYSNFFKDSLKRDARPSFFRISKKKSLEQATIVSHLKKV